MNCQPLSGGATQTARSAEPVVVRDVMIVDDHPLMCEALSLTLEHVFDLARVRQCAHLAAAEESIRLRGAPDAVVLDLDLPDVRGMEGLLALRARLGARVPITVISAGLDSSIVSAAIAAGARGVISKSLPRADMTDAFERMWQGERVLPEGMEATGPEDEEQRDLLRRIATLTPQQLRILRLLCEGRPNKVISWKLSISEATVKTHLAAIMAKINARNRTQAALRARRARVFPQ